MLLNNVVIGHSLESALFAYYNQFYFILSDNFQPLFFEECLDFSLFGTSNKREILSHTKDLLGFLSLNLEYPDLRQIRIKENKIKLFSDNLLFDFEFDMCYICNTLNVSHENAIVMAKPETYRVIDDFKVSRMGKEAVDVQSLYSEDKLLSEIHFYNSLRVDGSKYVTDIISVSNLSKQDLYDFEYSDTIATFKLRDCLKNIGYIGLKENFIYKSGKTKIKKVLLEHLKRYVLPIDNNQYRDSEIVKFINPQTKDFINGFAP